MAAMSMTAFVLITAVVPTAITSANAHHVRLHLVVQAAHHLHKIARIRTPSYVPSYWRVVC